MLAPDTQYELRVVLVDTNNMARDYVLAFNNTDANDGTQYHLGTDYTDPGFYSNALFSESPFHRIFFETEALSQLSTPDVTATATEDSITATWEAVTNATSYEVSLYEGGSVVPANQVGATQTTTGSSHTFTGLSAGTEYTAAVVAIGDPAIYADSAAGTTTITTEGTPLPQLDTPQNVMTTEIQQRAVIFSWDAVDDVVNYSVTIYSGSVVAPGNLFMGPHIVQVSSDLRHSYASLLPGTQYTVAVVAIANPATHKDSEPGTFTFTTPQLPQLTTPMVTATATTNSVTATWNEVANAVDYEVSLYEGDDIFGNQVGTTQTIDAASTRTATFLSLTPATTYTVAVVAIANPFTHRDSNPGTATHHNRATTVSHPAANSRPYYGRQS